MLKTEFIEINENHIESCVKILKNKNCNPVFCSDCPFDEHNTVGENKKKYCSNEIQSAKEFLEMVDNKDCKRKEYIDWDTYFMGVALLSAKRSKDPSTQVGACIVRNNKILSIGYNGFPIGCNDSIYPWNKDGEWVDTKYPYVCHAELNAILNSNNNLEDSVIYVNLFPCNECAKAIIQSGIREVVYLSDKDEGKPFNTASKRMLNSCGIITRKMEFGELILRAVEKETEDFKKKDMRLLSRTTENNIFVEIYDINPESTEYGKIVYYKVKTRIDVSTGTVESGFMDKEQSLKKVEELIAKYKQEKR